MIGNQNIPNPFIFSQGIDNDHIISMYEDDYGYIEEIFKTVLDHYDEDAGAIRRNLEANDHDGLRRAIHKMKPAFGFLGLLTMQEQCNQLEQELSKDELTEHLKQHTSAFIKALDNCRQLISEEYERLKIYNNPGI